MNPTSTNLRCIETVTITSKNYPTYLFGALDDKLYITTDNIVEFRIEIPGLSGHPNSASFKSVVDGKYATNHDGFLDLKASEDSMIFRKEATFEIQRDKFFKVRYTCMDMRV